MLNLIKTLFTDQLIAALSNMLLYSLIGGVFLAAVAGLIVIATNKVSAAKRYNLLVGTLALFAVSMVVVFSMQFNSSNERLVTAPISAVAGQNLNLLAPVGTTLMANAPQLPAVVEQVTYVELVTNYLTNHQDVIVLIWFLIICAKGIQLMVGLQGVYRLKYKDVSILTGSWNDAMQRLAHNLGIKQKVALLESGLAQVPMVIGHLKPVILIPIGLLTALTTAEVEAILMHELAHISRRDYLVNLLQCLLEVIFFFNPAVLWVSQLIKTEREHCCDDIALQQNTSRAEYIKALMRCEEFMPVSADYAMAMSGNRNGLLARAKRIATKHNNSLNIFEKTLLTICVMASVLCFSAFAKKDIVIEAADKVVSSATQNNPTKSQSNKAPAISIQKQKTDGLTVPEKAYIDQMLKQDKINKAAWDAEYKANPNASETAKYQTNVAREYMNGHLFVMLVEDGLIGKKRGSIDNLSFALTKQGELIVNGVKQPQKLYQKYNKSMHAPIPGPVEYSYTSTTYNANDSHVKNDNKIEPQTANMTEAEVKALKEKRRRVMVSDLTSDRLLTNAKNFSFTLTNDDFTLNKVKQPAKVHQKYAAKYLSGKMISWQYSFEGDADNNKMSESFGELK